MSDPFFFDESAGTSVHEIAHILRKSGSTVSPGLPAGGERYITRAPNPTVAPNQTILVSPATSLKSRSKYAAVWLMGHQSSDVEWKTVSPFLAEEALELSLLEQLLHTQTAVSVADLLTTLTHLCHAKNALLWERKDGKFAFASAFPIDYSAATRFARSAMASETTTIGRLDGKNVSSMIAAPLLARANESIGTLALIYDGATALSDSQKKFFHTIGKRWGMESSLASAYQRLLDEAQDMRKTALLDPLLGISSRAGVEKSIAQAISAAKRRKEPLSFLMFDVVGLHRINDQYGHRVGDQALAHVSRLLLENIRNHDIVGRFAGNQILVVLSGAGLDAARDVCNKLQSLCNESPLSLSEKQQIKIRLRAGISELGDDETTGDDVISRCLTGLSRARASGSSIHVATSSEESSSEVIHTTIAPGTTLAGMYKILHELSRGAMGVVYRAEDMGLGRQVAVKVLRSDLSADQKLVEQFRQEAGILASLYHPNLVQVYSFGAHEGDVFFVMELVEGESLADILWNLEQNSQFLDIPATIQILEEIGDALDELHASGLIHRDVKPANILLDQVRDRAVLVDVGVARKLDTRGDAAGTPGFAAPESFTDQDESPATDVYGLAATAYMMLTHEPPYEGESLTDVIIRQLRETPRSLSDFRTGIPDSIDKILRKGLAPTAQERYRSSSAFSIALSRQLARVAESIANESSPSQGDRGPQPNTDVLDVLVEEQAENWTKEASAKPRPTYLTSLPVEFDELSEK